MCVRFQSVISRHATKFAFVPCGKCEECRIAQKNSWTFRLLAEMESKLREGWQIGFFTLTYNNVHLPRLWNCLSDEKRRDVVNHLFEDVDLWHELECFSKSDVRTFVLRLRKWLHKHCKDKDGNRLKGCKYLIASELGEHTRRPHYHGIIAWPKGYVTDKGKKVDDELMHALITMMWRFVGGNGFVIPKNADGKECKSPFLCATTIDGFNACAYAGKYCCKDLLFERRVSKFDVSKKSEAFKDAKCFHVQSKSLGRSILETLKDDDARREFLKGYTFLGDKKSRAVPIYYRDRILFEPKYTYEEITELIRWNGRKYVKDECYVWNGQKFIHTKSDNFFKLRAQGVHIFRRLVEREATKFFNDNLEEIYEKKVDFYRDTFESCSKDSFWLSRGFSEKESANYSQVVRDYTKASCKDFNRLANDYLCYCGIDYSNAVDANPSRVWFSRYVDNKPFGQQIPEDVYLSLNKFFIWLFGRLHYCKKPKHDYLLDEIQDFWNSVT